MRRVTFRIAPAEGSFHPVSRELVEDPAVTPVAVHHVELLDDATVAMLAEVRGDAERYREILASTESVREFVVSAGGGTAVGYSRLVPNDLTRRLFERQRSTEFVVEFPVEYTEEGHQRYTVVGPDELFEGGIDTPADVDLTVESVRPYRPGSTDPFADLTDREREVLSTALDCGYYEVPRAATQDEVADRLGISSSAVGRHLRRIESKVFAGFRA